MHFNDLEDSLISKKLEVLETPYGERTYMGGKRFRKRVQRTGIIPPCSYGIIIVGFATYAVYIADDCGCIEYREDFESEQTACNALYRLVNRFANDSSHPSDK